MSVVGKVLTALKITVSPQEKNRRYDICRACPNYVKKWRRCRICHCYMPAKAKLFITSCPIDKW